MKNKDKKSEIWWPIVLFAFTFGGILLWLGSTSDTVFSRLVCLILGGAEIILGLYFIITTIRKRKQAKTSKAQ